MCNKRRDKVTELTGFTKSDVLKKYYLEDGSWIAVRPSGTEEPKCKFYYCMKENSKRRCSQQNSSFPKGNG